MRRLVALVLVVLPPLPVLADVPSVVQDTVEEHILPRVDAFAGAGADLAAVAASTCDPDDDGLRAAYTVAFDAWIDMSHLRFGPTEVADRAFAIAFWPDSRGATPKALAAMIVNKDPALADPVAFRDVSVAARGLYALEYLLFDDGLRQLGQPETRCALTRAITYDVAANGAAIAADWHDSYAARLMEPGPDGPYQTDAEAVQELFKALGAGLQFTADVRLGRPMGTFQRPRPNRAEARGSGRSLRHVVLSLLATQDLALHLAADDPELASRLSSAFEIALATAARLDDPVFAGVASPQGRIRVEALQTEINKIRQIVATELGPQLGVAAGFNALDGD
ncbi:imelysin family protein [Rhodobacteraceae bacterium F11138]|nr:imelysin family protein [Rhodobacteraceae bacterium F11138]